MRTICLYFQVHQPFRLRRYRFFDIGADHYYYDDYQNNSIMRKVAQNCYLPTNNILLEIIKELGDQFKVSFSISGMALEQFQAYAPDVLESFQKLAATGCVEFLAETYSHSLASLKTNEEFTNQVRLHSEKIEELFGQKPTVFRNTELIYSDLIGETVANLGFKGMITEGAKHILGWKSPNFLYYNAINPKLKLILKNFKLSDDIAFRFSNHAWADWPISSDKYVSWLKAVDKKEDTINLFMDYETFGEHQKAESGIFSFLRLLPTTILKETDLKFATPSELLTIHQPVSAIHVMYPISWADEERDITAWLGNELQNEAFNKLYEMESLVKQIPDPQIQRDWTYLQSSDHFYYMSTKFFTDGSVHKYFSPYNTPYDAFINYMNVLSDFIERIKSYGVSKPEGEFTEDEIKDQISELEQKLQELKEKIRPKVISKTKVQPKAIAKTKPENKAIEKTKKEVKAIEKTKEEPTAIEKTKEELNAIEKTKPETKAIAKTKKVSKAISKTKPETKAIEKTKKVPKAIAKTKPETKALTEAKKKTKKKK